MIIKRVKLLNIRSYLSEEIEFPSGTVLLSGDIGSGKSTILLAIEFALFGINKGLLSGEALLRHGKQAGYVELSFSFDGRDIVIKRSLKRLSDSVRQDEGFISINGLKQFCTADELKARVLEMLGYPKELLKKSKGLIYRYTVYTPQEDMKRILSEDPQARLDTLRRVFQIDKYKLVREGNAIVLQALREKRRELSARIEDLPAKQEQLSKLSASVSVVEKKLVTLAPMIAGAEESLAHSRQKLKLVEEQSRQLSLLRSQLAATSALTVEKARLILSRESEIASARREVAALQSMLKDNSSALAQLSSSLSKLKSYSDSLLGDVEGRKQMEAELASAERLRLEIESEIARAESLRLSSQQLKEKIASLSSCPTCLQPVHPDHRHKISAEEDGKIEGLASRLAAASEKRSSIISRIGSLKSSLSDLQSKEKIAVGLSSELRHYIELASVFSVPILPPQQSRQSGPLLQSLQPLMSVAEMQSELASLSAAKRALESSREKAMLVSEKERLMSVAESALASWKSELNVLEAKKAELSGMVSSFGDIEAETSSLKSEFDILVKDITGLMMQKASLSKERESFSSQAALLSEEIKRKESARNELESAANFSYWLDEIFSGMVGVIERHVMMKVHQEFNSLFRDWFAMLMGTDNLTARIDGEFTPVVEEGSFEIPVENLSGGEKTSCALAYRLALNMVINSLVSAIKTKDILILDEPTDGFSAEQLDKLRDVLHQLKLPQVILVSHEDRIESFVQHVIRIQKEQHVSRVVV